ncbi:MAG TPA: ROK family protein [Flavitalea sp.]|nr:ROK family protein [Flavitalea sp.]
MSLFSIDLGGTKLAVGIFNESGELLFSKEDVVYGKSGKQVADLICENIVWVNQSTYAPVNAIGISVPGISNSKTQLVWAPNIPGWDNYPLLKEVSSIAGNIPVSIESDRSCYILGEMWQGNAKGIANAIFLAVGTGIGAGIVADGRVLHGAGDIIGAVGWLALDGVYKKEYEQCGCFEFNASGNGIAKVARQLIAADGEYSGVLKNKSADEITTHDVLNAYIENDYISVRVMNNAITYWGMAVANLISIFNPEKILMGGGMFGPAVRFIPSIRDEAMKWAQPISAQQVSIEPSLLGAAAGMYGAAYLALQSVQNK